MKNIFKAFCIAAAIVACAPGFAQPQTPINVVGAEGSVDHLLRTANLKKLIGVDEALNLMAQTSDPDGSTTDANTFDDFMALGVDAEDGHTIITEFDKNQTILKQQLYDSPWIGVDRYKQHEIPSVTLQQGWRLAQSCMASKGDPIPEKISGAIIYKSILGHVMVYDYITKDDYDTDICSEVLYVPDTKECVWGMMVYCHFDPYNFFSVHQNKKKKK